MFFSPGFNRTKPDFSIKTYFFANPAFKPFFWFCFFWLFLKDKSKSFSYPIRIKPGFGSWVANPVLGIRVLFHLLSYLSVKINFRPKYLKVVEEMDCDIKIIEDGSQYTRRVMPKLSIV